MNSENRKVQLDELGEMISVENFSRMSDTDRDTLAIFNRMIMQKTPEERLIMGFSMYATAKEIVMSSILAKDPDASPEKIAREVFLRFYKNDFSESEVLAILGSLNEV